MFKLSIAFASIVLFQSVFAAPVLLTASTSKAAAAAVANRGLANALDIGDVSDNLNPEPRQNTGGLLGSFIPTDLLSGTTDQTRPPPPAAAPAQRRQYQVGDGLSDPDRVRREASVAGAFDKFLNSFLGGEDSEEATSQKREAPPAPGTDLSFDQLDDALADAISQDENDQDQTKRQLSPFGGEDGGSVIDSPFRRQLLSSGISSLPVLDASQDRRALLDATKSLGGNGDGNGDGQDGDNDNDDDNGKNDGGDNSNDSGDNDDNSGDDNDDNSDVDSRSDEVFPFPPLRLSPSASTPSPAAT